ncbi:MAG: hypothetical protein M3124_00455 [Actinomycetota bacterium]|nr:hypothetical protein [Actinomycetota bacterium]
MALGWRLGPAESEVTKHARVAGLETVDGLTKAGAEFDDGKVIGQVKDAIVGAVALPSPKDGHYVVTGHHQILKAA